MTDIAQEEGSRLHEIGALRARSAALAADVERNWEHCVRQGVLIDRAQAKLRAAVEDRDEARRAALVLSEALDRAREQIGAIEDVLADDLSDAETVAAVRLALEVDES